MNAQHRVIFLVSSILCSGINSPAFAQAVSSLPPPTLSTDENDVDLTTGRFTHSQEDVSIGPQTGSGRLNYVRNIGSYGQRSNWDMSLDLRMVNGQRIFYVVVGETSDRFLNYSGGAYTPINNEGQTLTQGSIGGTVVWTYKSRDGTTIQFDSAVQSCSANADKTCAKPSSVESPNGEKTNVIFQQVRVCSDPTERRCPLFLTRERLLSVNNNFGYGLNFTYALMGSPTANTLPQWQNRIKVTAVNSAIDACPVIGNCTGATQNWPTAAFSTSITPYNGAITVTDAMGRQRVYNYTSNQLTGIRPPGAAADRVSVTYDASGRVSQVVNAGIIRTYTYAVNGNMMSVTASNPATGNVVVTSNTNQNLPLTITDGLNRTTTMAYNTMNRLSQQTNPEGDRVEFAYDNRGNITQTTRKAKPGSSLADIVTTANFSATCTNQKICNQPEWVRDAKQNQTDYTYDANTGLVTTITAPAATAGGVRPQSRFSYTALQANFKNLSGVIVPSGQPVTLLTGTSTCKSGAACTNTTDETKLTVSYGPQTAGVANNLLPVSATASAGDGSLSATTSFTYDAIGNRVTVDGPLAGTADTARTRFDAARQVTGVVGPDPDGAGALKNRALKPTYNLEGQTTLTEIGTVNGQSDADWAAFNSLQQTTNVYDSNARQTQDSVAAGGATFAVSHYSYDTLGRPQCTAQRMDPAQWTAQTSPCTPQTTGPNGPDRVTRQVYDAASQVTKVQVAVGTSDQSDEVTNSYTNNGQQVSVTDGENNLTTYEYDGFDRLAKTRYPVPSLSALTSSTTDFEQLTYDANGNVTQRRLRDGQLINLSYDALNRVILKDVPNVAYSEYDISYTYDLLGRSLTLSSPQGYNSTLTYDALGRMTSEASVFGTKALQYDAAGRLTQLTHPDGFFVTYDYLTTGEVSTIRENGGAALATYAYDNLGNRTSITRGNGTVTSYAFDPISRLSQLSHDVGGTAQDVTSGFTYNPAGQIAGKTRSNDAYAWTGHANVTRPYVTNGLNQYSASGNVALGYDGLGNLNASGATTYTYTSENRLASVPGINYLWYDPAGRLLLSGTEQPYAYTFYDYVGSALEAEYGYPARQLLRRYVYGPGVDEPIVWYEGAGLADKRFLHADERGSVVAISNGSGTVTNVHTYDDYGIPGSANVGRFQYTGQAWLPELGMYYYKARIYSPTLGRFMQTDPIGYGDGVNWYNYVGGDPVNRTDPTGLSFLTTENFPRSDPGRRASQVNREIIVNGRRPPRASPPSAFTSQLRLQGGFRNGGTVDSSLEIIENLFERIKRIGKDGEAQIRESLIKSDNIILGEQVYIITDIGLRITDFIIIDVKGNISGVEVKTNGGRYSNTQRLKDISISQKGGIISSGTRLTPQLKPGSIARFQTIHVNVYSSP